MTDRLTPQQLAERTAIALATLTKMRCQRRGPSYIKLAGKIWYPLECVEAWERSQLVACDAATVAPVPAQAKPHKTLVSRKTKRRFGGLTTQADRRTASQRATIQ